MTKTNEKKHSIEELEDLNKRLTQINEDTIKLAKLMSWRLDFELHPNGDKFFANELMTEKFGLVKSDDGYYEISQLADSGYPDQEGKDSIKKMFVLFNECLNNKKDEYSVIVKHINKNNNEVVYMEHNAKVFERFPNNKVKIMNGYNHDVTKQVIAQKRLEYMTNHDLMTGLRNRNSFENYVNTIDKNRLYSVILFDIDGLKFINDAYGHLKGDQAIKLASKAIVKAFKDDTTIFRIGGDEFTIISNIYEDSIISEKLGQINRELETVEKEFNSSLSISCGYQINDTQDKGFIDLFIEAENEMYRQKLGNRVSRKSKSLKLVMETLNQKTEETIEHCERMEEKAIKLMKRVGYNRHKDFDDMKLLCAIHDIGKITVSLDILNKPSLLDGTERKAIEKHAEAGYKIAKSIVDSDRIAQAVLYHHERIDSKGYPFGLDGYSIPEFAKILAIVDSYDAMTTERVYSKPMSKEKAIKEIKSCAGKQFDYNYAMLFVKIIEEEIKENQTIPKV